MNEFVRRRPNEALGIVRRANISSENCTLNRVDPHEQWRPGMDHGERCHGSNTPKVPFRIVLPRIPWANLRAFDVSRPALVQQITANIFANVVTDEN